MHPDLALSHSVPTIALVIAIREVSEHDATLAGHNARFALNSGGSPSKWDRWSFIPAPPTCILQCDAFGQTTLSNFFGIQKQWSDPIEALQWLSDQLSDNQAHRIETPNNLAAIPSDLPAFKTGWIGYLSYELGFRLDNVGIQTQPSPGDYLFRFTYHNRVISIDHHQNRYFECHDVSSSRPETPLLFTDQFNIRPTEITSNFDASQYQSAVERALQYISAGDIFQVNLSQQFAMGLPAHPDAIYRELRRVYPAWFGAFLNYGDQAIICNSPELFLRVSPRNNSRRSIVTRPIKGTRPVDTDPTLKQFSELQHSDKDKAELNMIVDLERNDLGRICNIGSINVNEQRVIETHPTVYHGAATISGELRNDIDFLSILRATFPGGSITGAPKIRATQIIHELEKTVRGPYCGSIGYLSNDGHMQFNIAIRTIHVRNDRLNFSAGGGIVADSNPRAEYEETLVKARAIRMILDKLNGLKGN